MLVSLWVFVSYSTERTVHRQNTGYSSFLFTSTKLSPSRLAHSKLISSERCKRPMQPFPDISFNSLLPIKTNSFLPARLMCKAIFYLAYLWFSEAQAYCNMPKLSHNIDGSGELSVIHECLTPLKTWQRSFWDSARLIKAGYVSLFFQEATNFIWVEKSPMFDRSMHTLVTSNMLLWMQFLN